MGDPWASSLFGFLLCHSSPPIAPSLLHTHLLSVGSFAVFFLPPLVSPALSPSLSVLQCFTPSIPHSHRGLIYFHYWVKRRAFVCHQQRSHGAMLGVTARVTNLLPSLTSMLACAWNSLNVGGKNRVCVRVCASEKVPPSMFAPKSVSLNYF